MPARLVAADPSGPPPSSDELLGRFLSYASDLGLSLYPAQEEAIFEILAGKHVVLATPTGSGKSLVATAFLYKALAEGKRGFYSCPVKALVNEKFFALCDAFGPDRVALMTGDATVNRDAPIVCGTAEILANVALRADRAEVDAVVMDEFHYYGDRERGIAWQLPLISLPKATFLLMSATLGDTRTIEQKLQTFTGREVSNVRGATRPVPLEFTYKETALHETVLDLARDNRAPIYLVNFTQRAAAEEAQNLLSLDLTSKPDKEAIRAALVNERFTSPYGKEIQRFLRQGIGVHHAGLLPRYRRLVERLAQRGLLKVVSGTDTLGVGVNIPIRTVLFTQLCKYDGQKDSILSVREFHQIAGRAGRKGFDDQGYVVAQAPPHVIENRKLAATGKKFVKRQPPKKGFIHWDKSHFDKLVAGTPEALESRFAVTHGLLIAALQAEGTDPRRGAGYGRLIQLIGRCHDSDVRKRHHRRMAAGCFRTLRHAGLIELARDERAANPYPIPSGDLQSDFSLHHTLSLYLVDTLDKLDPSVETHAFDVLTLVESILENPRPVLMAQVDGLKDELMAQMKAEGVEYEQRIEKLDEVEWPKPNREFIYDTFNDFAERHPWVGQENIAPKSVARELLERFCSFNDYVRALGLERGEGVLLRYLSDAYRTLTQTVPARHRTPEVEELALSLGALVRTVDASLLEEWEALRDPLAAAELLAKQAGAGGAEPAPPPGLADPARDGKALLARVRAELHRLLGALSRKDWPEALSALGPAREGSPEWTGDGLAQALGPYFEQHKQILVTPAARTPRQTRLSPIGDRMWEATQVLVDPAGEEDWALHAIVDLRAESRAGLPSETPIVTLVRIGP